MHHVVCVPAPCLTFPCLPCTAHPRARSVLQVWELQYALQQKQGEKDLALKALVDKQYTGAASAAAAAAAAAQDTPAAAGEGFEGLGAAVPESVRRAIARAEAAGMLPPGEAPC